MNKRLDYFNNENIGLFIVTNDTHTYVPLIFPEKSEWIKEVLGTELVRTEVNGSDLLGVYVAMNNNNAIFPEGFETSIKGTPFKSKLNAFGNNIAVNDKIALVNPDYSKKEQKEIGDVLGVEVIPIEIAGYKAIGSVLKMNNKGFVVHYKAEDMLDQLKDILGIPGEAGTINKGVGFIKLGLVLNNNGYIVGMQTTGFEMGVVEQIFL